MGEATSREQLLHEAASLMLDFAERTGLTSSRPERRYLWTDAFAVCNLVDLARATGEARYGELALRLVEQVHLVLGRHREDDPRKGWISGLGAQEGELHPTRGGLRIGKSLPERAPGEPFDERLEWDRDGQYFHYLTQWMRALDQVALWTRRPHFNLWARELAETAHAAFAQRSPRGARPQMVWKMSIDLSRPLVPSMGQHDPLDGFLTCLELQTSASLLSRTPSGPSLEAAVADFRTMIEARDWTTADPLGLGGLLLDACHVDRLTRLGASVGDTLLEDLLAAAADGLADYARRGDLLEPPAGRLAFRELGLAIGLACVEAIEAKPPAGLRPLSRRAAAALEALRQRFPLGSAIVAFWLDPEHRGNRTWAEHRDINEVMLATSALAQDGAFR